MLRLVNFFRVHFFFFILYIRIYLYVNACIVGWSGLYNLLCMFTDVVPTECIIRGALSSEQNVGG